MKMAVSAPQTLLPSSALSIPPSTPSTNLIPPLTRISPLLLRAARTTSRLRTLCSSSPGPGSGEKESRAVLDAFFLGKAVAEALTERIESTVGEFLSTVGRLQAEQQKQVQEFQEEVFERANKAKEKAAKEAMEEWQGPGLVPTSQESYTAVTVMSDASSAATVNDPVTIQGDEATDGDPLSGVSTQE